MLTFDNVRFQYDCEDFSIIDHLSFTVQDGEFVSVSVLPAAEKVRFFGWSISFFLLQKEIFW